MRLAANSSPRCTIGHEARRAAALAGSQPQSRTPDLQPGSRTPRAGQAAHVSPEAAIGGRACQPTGSPRVHHRPSPENRRASTEGGPKLVEAAGGCAEAGRRRAARRRWSRASRAAAQATRKERITAPAFQTWTWRRRASSTTTTSTPRCAVGHRGARALRVAESIDGSGGGDHQRFRYRRVRDAAERRTATSSELKLAAEQPGR